MDNELARYCALTLPALSRHCSPIEEVRWESDGQGGGRFERYVPAMRATFTDNPGASTSWLAGIRYDRIAVVNEEWWVAYVRHAVHKDIIIGIWQHCDDSGYLPLVFRPGTKMHGFEPDDESSANFACVYGREGRSKGFKELKTLTEAISKNYEDGSPWYWFPYSDKPVPEHWEWFFRAVQQVRIDRDDIDEHLLAIEVRNA